MLAFFRIFLQINSTKPNQFNNIYQLDINQNNFIKISAKIDKSLFFRDNDLTSENNFTTNINSQFKKQHDFAEESQHR